MKAAISNIGLKGSNIYVYLCNIFTSNVWFSSNVSQELQSHMQHVMNS